LFCPQLCFNRRPPGWPTQLLKENVLKKALFAVCLIALGTTAAQASWTGKASYYGGGGRTASGGHVGARTAAHRSLPFGTQLRVTNLHNRKSVVVTVNDRGPFVRGRIVDVSTGAAGVLGMKGAGVAPVRVEVVSR
jgi:rare lipoprotein A